MVSKRAIMNQTGRGAVAVLDHHKVIMHGPLHSITITIFINTRICCRSCRSDLQAVFGGRSHMV